MPDLKKSLLSISKLTVNLPVEVVFTDENFVIQNRETKAILGRERREHGLYILDTSHSAFAASVRSSSLKALFELWHARLGHVSFETILFLNKHGLLSVTSVLPKPTLCHSCQLAKSKRLPFTNIEKRATCVLDLIHCDLWDPAPVESSDGYRFYVIFVDDFSQFTWLYPLRSKFEFYDRLLQFTIFAQTQFSRSIKIFQIDGGTEFLNFRV